MYQEKDKYRLLIENLPDGLAYCKMVRDNTGKPVDYIFLEVNSSFKTLSGLPRDHIIGKKVTELYPGIKGLGFDWIGVFDQVAAIGTGQSIRFQQYLDQQGRWYEITAYSDQPGYFAVIFHDITQHKQAEEKLFETKEYLEKLIKYANAPIIVWDTSLSITRFNQAFENLSGYDASEVIGKKIDILFSKNKIESALEHIQKTSSGERWETVEIEIQRKDGEPRIVLWNSANILDTKRNNVIATIAQGQDITKRKQAEETLHKSERNLTAIMNASTESIFLMDMEGGLLAANETLAQRLGTDLKTLLRGNFYEFLPPDVAKNRKSHVKQVIKSGKPLYFEDERFGRTILNSLYPIFDSKEQTIRLAVVGMDITERKKMEEREHHLKQVLLAIRHVNQLIVQETDPERLIERACQNLTETLGYYNAWIALLDEGGKVTSTAASGFDDGYNLFEKQLKQGKYPFCIKKAFQEKGTIVIDSASDSCPDCPLYSGHVGRAGLSGRIQYGDKLYGMLSVSIPREYANLEETSKLFIELAGDLGLALYKIALEEKRKQAEEALRTSEERYRLLVENANEAILVAQDGMLKFVNRMTAELIGYSEQELTSRPFPEFIHPDDRGMVVERHLKRLKGDVFQPRYAFRLVARDGSIKWVEIGAVLIDWEGRPATLNFLNDITERKQAEEAIQESENRFRELFNHMSSGVIIYEAKENGRDFIIKNINPAVEKIEKIKKEDILGKSVLKVFPAVKDFGLFKVFQEVWKTGKPQQHPLSLYQDQRITGWRENYVCKLPSGEITVVYNDITARKRAEEVLRKSEEKWRSLVSILPDYVSLLDREDRFLFLNHYAEGFTEKEIIGSSVYQYLSTQSKEIFEKEIAECQNTGKIRKFEHTAMGDHGIMREYEDYLVPILEKNKTTSTMVISRDITERRKAEEEIRQKAKDLQEKNAELTRFIYAVSHDLRSPLVTIQTFQGHLEGDIRSQDAARVEKDLGYIRNAADKMGRLLNELLRFSRVGRIMNPSEEAPLQAIVKEALDLVAGRITGRGVRIDLTEEPVVLYGDRTRLVEVFLNLVDNAVKFMGDEPMPRVEIGVEQAGEELVLHVRDNGIGIDPRLQPMLFGLFHKLDPETEGEGIGLALVKQIVELHGGRIWVESAGIGTGATFRFTLAKTRRKRVREETA